MQERGIDIRRLSPEAIDNIMSRYEERIEQQAARIKELQDLIDKPPEEADWVADYHLLQSALDGPIIDAARKWHAAYRKAQNSNLMRAKEVGRLRSENLELRVAVLGPDGIRANQEVIIGEQAARIKELESEITAWIADRDSWIARYEAVREAPREMAELMAREALARIKEGKG